MKLSSRQESEQIGSNQDDFEIEVVPVQVYKTRKDRVVDMILTVITTVVAVTIAQVVIIPLFA